MKYALIAVAALLASGLGVAGATEPAHPADYVIQQAAGHGCGQYGRMFSCRAYYDHRRKSCVCVGE